MKHIFVCIVDLTRDHTIVLNLANVNYFDISVGDNDYIVSAYMVDGTYVSIDKQKTLEEARKAVRNIIVNREDE